MSSLADSIGAKELGNRLKIARESAFLTQAEAAEKLQIARTTLVAIERGNRTVRIEELQGLSRIYGVTVGRIVRKDARSLDLIPRFRQSHTSQNIEAEEATRLFNSLVSAELELEELLGIERKFNLPAERPVRGDDVRHQAIQDSLELRGRLGLAMQPVIDMIALLELEFGVRVYLRSLPRKIDGLYAYDDLAGPCIMLNARHRRDRRNQTAAHELGHLVSCRSKSDISVTDELSKSPHEIYARVFGRYFLLPEIGLTFRFREITAGSDRLTRKHVIFLAFTFGVSREALVRQLEDFGLAAKGTWEWFDENGGISDEQARQVLGDLDLEFVQDQQESFPMFTRVNLLAAEAHRKQLIGEGQLSEMLQMSRVEVRKMLAIIGDGDEESNGAPILPKR